MITSCTACCSLVPDQYKKWDSDSLRLPAQGSFRYLKQSYIHSNGRLRRGKLQFSVRSAWRDVVDPTSGRTYYWNTETNETTWEKPSEIAVDLEPLRLDASPTTTANAAVPNAQILDNLKEAYNADTSGMTFWEIARSHRSDGVFDEGFTEFLNDQIETAPDEDNRCDNSHYSAVGDLLARQHCNGMKAVCLQDGAPLLKGGTLTFAPSTITSARLPRPAKTH
ncbi:hypothetical protein COCOBI_14-2180 [Coccomyxa sp. Obi]|nr:hypothetical protein COCOBI_14-2180 [Coccomyxa sp. Obi]